ncbi:hypothetical protein FJ976_02780 [Mesorhizobium sp. B1-1-9]|uniref:hypothetical protein n=1 Tax=Mesorhizobium sp. B1-1-9 TaxID=2589975 RepID=UPI00112973A8|nr:hypothetical protein [Mesorhizobium sp. B1-1-9]TPN57580.1 hypothetical protein FJ976_02780 [Mesorhizobium sp. B1-1-9]
MPNTHVPAAGEAMPAAEVMPIIGRFSGRVILGDVAVQMAAAALQIQRDAASIAAALTIIHGGKYLVMINHEVGFVSLVRRS